MADKDKQIDPLPEDFGSYEIAGEFWDTHDTTDYLGDSRPVAIFSELRGRYYEVEIEEKVVKDLRTHAEREGMTLSMLANDLLRKQLTTLNNLDIAA